MSSNLYIINDNTFFKSNLANSVLNGSSSLSGLIDPMSYEVIDPINEIYKKTVTPQQLDDFVYIYINMERILHKKQKEQTNLNNI